MTNDELNDKLQSTHDAVIRIEGSLGVINETLKNHFTADQKVEERVDKIEGRQWHAVWLALGAIIEGAVVFFSGSNKH